MEVLLGNLGDAREGLLNFKTSLGPNAMHKLVASHSDSPNRTATLTIDGSTIAHALLQRPTNLSPAARLALAACAEQSFRCGDGVCTLATLACELLAATSQLVERGIAADVIAEGLTRALGVALPAAAASPISLPPLTSQALVSERVAMAMQTEPAAIRDVLSSCITEVLKLDETVELALAELTSGLDRIEVTVTVDMGPTEVNLPSKQQCNHSLLAQVVRGLILAGVRPVDEMLAGSFPEGSRLALLASTNQRNSQRPPKTTTLGSAAVIRTAAGAADRDAAIDADALAAADCRLIVSADRLLPAQLQSLRERSICVLQAVGEPVVRRIGLRVRQRVLSHMGAVSTAGAMTSLRACNIQRRGDSVWTQLLLDGVAPPLTLVIRGQSVLRHSRIEALCSGAIELVKATAAGEQTCVAGAGMPPHCDD